jgi:thioredoxin reductase (NADPH)
LRACALIVATGARYRNLNVTNHEHFEGQGIHYAATAMEAQLCVGEEVVVVGGGNSAGQAAVFLARLTAHVHMLVRGSGLAETMSDYLVQRIRSSPKITLHVETEITAFEGDERLRRVTWTHCKTRQSETYTIGNVFLMIGAAPNTEWLNDCLELDQDGFIRTAQGADGTPFGSPYATSKKGIFAVGDVRSGSVKRVAAGVGEGSVVIHSVHQFLNPDVA